MGFNTSQRKRSNAVLRASLQEFGGWSFQIQCGKCRHRRVLPVNDLLVLYPGDVMIMKLLDRLRCSRCGAVPGRIAVVNRLHEILVVGQGAYG